MMYDIKIKYCFPTHMSGSSREKYFTFMKPQFFCQLLHEINKTQN